MGNGINKERADQHLFSFLRMLVSMLPALTGFRRSSLGLDGFGTILEDLPLARAPAAVIEPPEGPW